MIIENSTPGNVIIELALSALSFDEARGFIEFLKYNLGYKNDRSVRRYLAYEAGRFSDNTRLTVEKYYKTEHPYFLSISSYGPPSPEEALILGQCMEFRIRKCSNLQKLRKLGIEKAKELIILAKQKRKNQFYEHKNC